MSYCLINKKIFKEQFSQGNDQNNTLELTEEQHKEIIEKFGYLSKFIRNLELESIVIKLAKEKMSVDGINPQKNELPVQFDYKKLNSEVNYDFNEHLKDPSFKQ